MVNVLALITTKPVHAVVHAPGGAGFTECLPDYPRDEAAMAAYAAKTREHVAGRVVHVLQSAA